LIKDGGGEAPPFFFIKTKMEQAILGDIKRKTKIIKGIIYLNQICVDIAEIGWYK